ncbi:MAG: GlsB/YeaQ/YmgE family stress response membrane protein [Gemmataceae bacterium]
MDLLWGLLIGLAAGWLAGQIWKGSDFGLAGDLVIGVVGALLGGFLFRLLGSSGPDSAPDAAVAFVASVSLAPART